MSLFHYTTSNGVMGILNNKAMFLTHSGFMNDHKELIHGVEIITNVWKENILNGLDSHFEKTEINTSNKNVPEDIFKAYIQYRRKDTKETAIKSFDGFVRGLIESSDIYSCSFSQNGDLLSQWRGYGGNEVGYCIEFDEELILSHMENSQMRSSTFAVGLSKCIYRDEDKEKIALELNERLENQGKTDDDFMFIGESLMEAIKFKDESFFEENEKRIIVKCSSNSVDIKFREKAGVIIPYIEYEFPIEAIKSIKVGPSNRQDQAAEGLRKYVDYIFSEEAPEILTSEIPYRMT